MRHDSTDDLAHQALVELLATAGVRFANQDKYCLSQRVSGRLYLRLPRRRLDRICAAAGTSVSQLMAGPGLPTFGLQATPALRKIIRDQGMIYDVEAEPIGDHYYLDLLDNDRLLCVYQNIIGSRQVATVQACDLEVLEMRAAEILRAAIPKQHLQLVQRPESAESPSPALTRDPQLVEQLRLLSPERVRLLLPTVQLSRYQDIKRMVLKAGGKYHRDGHFQFRAGTDVDELLQRLLAGERINEQQQTQFFATPAAQADQVCAKAGPLPGKKVLDPSGGDGALLDAAQRAGARAADVFAIENWEPNVQILRDKGYTVVDRDLLEVDPADTGLFDAVVMNPPFSKGQDLRHLKHAMAFVEPSGSLTAIVSASFEFQSSKVATNFRELLEVAGVQPHELPAGTFRESGTDVRTMVVHFDMPDLRRRLQECGREPAEFGFTLAPEGVEADDLADATLLAPEAVHVRERVSA